MYFSAESDGGSYMSASAGDGMGGSGPALTSKELVASLAKLTKDSKQAQSAASVAAQGLAQYSALAASVPVKNTPRSTYDKKRRATTRLTLNLIMTLDAQQIRSIRSDFLEFEGATVSLPQFVDIMRKHIRHEDLNTTEQKLVQSLVELFDSMDLDGDRSLDFDEFLATIVHMGMGAADHLVINPVKPYRDGPHLMTTKHNTEQVLCYVPGIDLILCTEMSNNIVKLIDPATLRVRRRMVIDVNRSVKERERERQKARVAQFKEKRAEHEEKKFENAGPNGVAAPPAMKKGSAWGALLGGNTRATPSEFAGFNNVDLESAASGGTGDENEDKRFRTEWARQMDRENGPAVGTTTKERFLKNAKAKPATLSAEYMHKNSRGEVLDILVTSTAQQIYLWSGITSSAARELRLVQEIETPHPITVLKWFPDHDLLYTGTSTGSVDTWLLKQLPPDERSAAAQHLHHYHRQRAAIAAAAAAAAEQNQTAAGNSKSPAAEKKKAAAAAAAAAAAGDDEEEEDLGPQIKFSVKRQRSFVGHTDLVTAIEHIPSMDLLLTASLDGTIRMWDLVHGTEKMRFPGHRAGIIALAYSDEYRFILSASIDHEVGVWSPFADRIVFKLSGHSAPLIGVQFVHGTPQIVSADADGWVKIWDARNFNCIQTLMSVPGAADLLVSGAGGGGAHINSFTTCGEYHKRICVAGRNHLYAFDQEGGPYSKLGEEDPVFAAFYNQTLLTFMTAGRRDVKIWNALNGRLARVYRGLSDTEITAICLDHRQRKLILGDHSGKIRVFNYLTGAYMKSLTPHREEVTSLHYINRDKTLISAGRDQVIMIHDEKPMEDQRVLVLVKPPTWETHEMMAISFSSELEVFCAASSDGNIYIWNLDLGQHEGTCAYRTLPNYMLIDLTLVPSTPTVQHSGAAAAAAAAAAATAANTPAVMSPKGTARSANASMNTSRRGSNATATDGAAMQASSNAAAAASSQGATHNRRSSGTTAITINTAGGSTTGGTAPPITPSAAATTRRGSTAMSAASAAAAATASLSTAAAIAQHVPPPLLSHPPVSSTAASSGGSRPPAPGLTIHTGESSVLPVPTGHTTVVSPGANAFFSPTAHGGATGSHHPQLHHHSTHHHTALGHHSTTVQHAGYGSHAEAIAAAHSSHHYGLHTTTNAAAAAAAAAVAGVDRSGVTTHRRGSAVLLSPKHGAMTLAQQQATHTTTRHHPHLYHKHTTEVISAILFLDQYPFLVSGDEGGVLCLWHISAGAHHGGGGAGKYPVVFRWLNRSRATGAVNGVTALAFDPSTEVLYTGSTQGDVLGWNLRTVLSVLGEKKLIGRQTKASAHPHQVRPRNVQQQAIERIQQQQSAVASSHHQHAGPAVGSAAHATKSALLLTSTHAGGGATSRASTIGGGAINTASATSNALVSEQQQTARAIEQALYQQKLLSTLKRLKELAETIKPELEIAAHTFAIRSLTFIPEPASLITASQNHQVFLWSTKPAPGGSTKGVLFGALDSMKALREMKAHNKANTANAAFGGGTTGTKAQESDDLDGSDQKDTDFWQFGVDVRRRETNEEALSRDILTALQISDNTQLLEKHGITYSPPKANKSNLTAGADGDEYSPLMLEILEKARAEEIAQKEKEAYQEIQRQERVKLAQEAAARKHELETAAAAAARAATSAFIQGIGVTGVAHLKEKTADDHAAMFGPTGSSNSTPKHGGSGAMAPDPNVAPLPAAPTPSSAAVAPFVAMGGNSRTMLVFSPSAEAVAAVNARASGGTPKVGGSATPDPAAVLPPSTAATAAAGPGSPAVVKSSPSAPNSTRSNSSSKSAASKASSAVAPAVTSGGLARSASKSRLPDVVPGSPAGAAAPVAAAANTSPDLIVQEKPRQQPIVRLRQSPSPGPNTALAGAAATASPTPKLPPFSPSKPIGASVSPQPQSTHASTRAGGGGGLASSASMPALAKKAHGRTRSVMDEEKARMMREYGGGGVAAASDVEPSDVHDIDSVPAYNNRRQMMNAAAAAAAATGAPAPAGVVAPGHTRAQRTYKKTQPLSEFFAAMRATSLESATSFALAGTAKAKLNTKQLSAADRLDFALRNS